MPGTRWLSQHAAPERRHSGDRLATPRRDLPQSARAVDDVRASSDSSGALASTNDEEEEDDDENDCDDASEANTGFRVPAASTTLVAVSFALTAAGCASRTLLLALPNRA